MGGPLRNLSMTHKEDENNTAEKSRPKQSWGPKLFISAFLAILVFFYWLLIYSGGVTVHHG